MADVTEEDLESKRETVEGLREQITEAHSVREERERALSREIEMKQLEAEEARLRFDLANAKAAAQMSAVKAGASVLLDNAAEQTKASAAQAKAAEKAASKADDAAKIAGKE